jgi:uncharacterized membrane protein YhiD involved in acid resistance
MLELFSSNEYYQLPSFEVAIFSLLLSFVLSTLIAFTYQLTRREQGYSKNFFQAIVLSSVITSTVMMAIGDSIARGLGILGAIAIIRFRARVNNPRNIIFIFAGLMVGVATGIYGYAVAVAGTIIFCSVAFLLKFSGYGLPLIRENRISIDTELTLSEDQVLKAFQPYCEKCHISRVSKTKKERRFVLRVTLKKETNRLTLTDHILAIEGFKSINISVRENAEQV